MRKKANNSRKKANFFRKNAQDLARFFSTQKYKKKIVHNKFWATPTQVWPQMMPNPRHLQAEQVPTKLSLAPGRGLWECLLPKGNVRKCIVQMFTWCMHAISSTGFWILKLGPSCALTHGDQKFVCQLNEWRSPVGKPTPTYYAQTCCNLSFYVYSLRIIIDI